MSGTEDAPVVERDYYESGGLKSEIEILAGLRHGRTRYWFECGALMVEGNFYRGYCEGVVREWYADGLLMCEYEMLSGKYHGFYRSWWKNGNQKELGHWLMGVRQPGYCWYRINGSVWRVLEEE